jgi:hypothetical protein
VADPAMIPEPASFGLLFVGLARFDFMGWLRSGKRAAH